MIIKKPNNNHIEIAIDFLDGTNELVKNGTIDRTFKSYISSFGGSIIQSGLMGTLMTFEANKNKVKIINALFEIYNRNFTENKIEKPEVNSYFYKIIKSKSETEKKEIRNKLVDMAVALKLAMRCFETQDNNSYNDENNGKQ